MKAYSPGSGASLRSTMTTSLSSCSRASFVANSDPRASPSGFSWVVRRKRSCERRTSTTVARSLVSGELIDELCHADPTLDRRIVLEGQLRGPLQPELPRDPRLQHAVRRREPGQALLALALRAEDADKDTRVAEVRRSLDSGDGDEDDPGGLQLADAFREHRPERFVDAAHAVTHRASRDLAFAGRAPIPGRSGSARRRRGAARPRAPRVRRRPR